LTTIGILGLGEAGSAIAADLAEAGVEVRGYDPARHAGVDGVDLVDDAPAAARGADAVLSLNAAGAAVAAAESVASTLVAGQLFADLNTAAPAVKRAAADIVAPTGADFADVALIGPVPGNGVRTPALVSGSGAQSFARILGEVGMPVTVVGSQPGEAAARKLVRSVFAKGLAAAIGESLAAARALDVENWLYPELERTLTEADGALLRRLIESSLAHAERRSEEMAAAVAMLEELGVEPRVAAAAAAWLRSLVESEVAR
jgi:3-hydroxyisobutyrate dehydrogenase-like beta-hydroxyacid dehydrogenase